MGITEFIAQYATHLIDTLGYPGVFVLMVMESMVFPVPSEAVMPFAGFLIVEGKFSWIMVILASTAGSIVGSLVSYGMGLYGGKPVIDRFGKYLLLDNEDLDATIAFFKKRGEVTIFICRFIPVVRHLISIPAGLGRMNIVRFSFYTIVGACLWNIILTVCGFFLRQNWGTVMKYSHVVDIVVVIVLLGGMAYFVSKHLKRTKNKKMAQ